MFGWKLIRDDEYAQLKENYAIKSILHEAHRWLSEFDWFLEPFWNHLFRKSPGDIAYCREKMRLALIQKLKEQT